jgi:hypothetical protein
MPYDEVKEFVRAKERSGWEIVGFERASPPEDVMIDTDGARSAVRTNKPAWRFDIPKTMDDRTDAPAKATVPPYLQEDVRASPAEVPGDHEALALKAGLSLSFLPGEPVFADTWVARKKA